MVKELQDDLLRKYMEEAIGPIVDSIEENLYAGKYDFSDSSSPSSNFTIGFNYLLKNCINHAKFIFKPIDVVLNISL